MTFAIAGVKQTSTEIITHVFAKKLFYAFHNGIPFDVITH